MTFLIEESIDLPGQKLTASAYRKKQVLKWTFFNCRQDFVMSMKNQRFIQSLCETCENEKLKLSALKFSGVVITNLTETLDEMLCLKSNSWWSPECADY